MILLGASGFAIRRGIVLSSSFSRRSGRRWREAPDEGTRCRSPRYAGGVMRVTPVRRQRSRHLRQELTPSELRVWSWLRDRRFGDYKFRRQFAIGPFILDFYCAAF